MKRSLRTQAIDFAAHMRRRWYLYLPVFAIWAFAYTRLFIDPTPRVPVLFNWTGSLPYRVALLQHGEHPLQRGEFVIFSFPGRGLLYDHVISVLVQTTSQLAGHHGHHGHGHGHGHGHT